MPRIRSFVLVLVALFIVPLTTLAATLTAVIPTSAPTGSRVILTGTGLDAGDLQVTFSGAGGSSLSAPIVSRNTGVVEAIVPVGATSGTLRVTSGGATLSTFAFTVTPPTSYTRVATLAGGPKVKDALDEPLGVAVDPATGIVYVADPDDHQIRAVTPSGAVSVLAGSGKSGERDGSATASQFREPYGLALDVQRKLLYVSDRKSNVIRRVDLAQQPASSGFVTTFAGSGKSGDRDGNGTTAELKKPAGLAIDAAGNLYVADSGNDKIRMSTPQGAVSTLAGSGRSGYADGAAATALFHDPRDVTVSREGMIFVADTKNNVIRRIDPTQKTVTTVAGTTQKGSADGPVAVATFNHPNGLAWDESGALFVTEDSGDDDDDDDDEGEEEEEEDDEEDDDEEGSSRVGIRRIDLNTATVATLASGKGFVDGPLANARFKELTGIASLGAIFFADSGNHAVRVAYPRLAARDLYPREGALAGGDVIRIFGEGFVPGATSVTFGIKPATTVTFITPTEILVTTPAAEFSGPVDVTITTPEGSTPLAFRYGPRLVGIALQPASVSLASAASQQVRAIGTYSDGSQKDLTQDAAWVSDAPAIATVSSGLVRAVAIGRTTIRATRDGLATTVEVVVSDLPPDPQSVAPRLDPTRVPSFADANTFLYTGPNAIQTGVAPGAIEARRAAVVRGRVSTRDGQPLSGVRITIAGHPELGFTRTRQDGAFDLAVNGGETLIVRYAKEGFLPVDRELTVPWNDYAWSASVRMTALDAQVTTVDLSAPQTQAARGSVVVDSDGRRQATVLFPPATAATAVLPDGSSRALTTLNVRATEYTVGAAGPASMPAALPTQSGYTYCVELSADEVIAAGATTLRFSQPVIVYVENFLNFPAGGIVPAGYYDRTSQRWISSANGRIITVLSVSGGVASVDVNGDWSADAGVALEELGITTNELAHLATLYKPSTSLWRVPVTHFTPWDFNWPYGPPAGATAPAWSIPGVERRTDNACRKPGSVIECENQVLGESMPIHGTPFSLHYQSDRVAGRRVDALAKIDLTRGISPSGAKRVELKVLADGKLTERTFSTAANQSFDFFWDDKDPYGRRVYGARDVKVEVGYVYDAVYQQPATFGESFAQLSGVPISSNRSRQEITVSQRYSVPLERWENRSAGLGGWSLSVHHAYDARAARLYLGSGERRSVDPQRAQLVQRFAGQYGKYGTSGDGGPALSATFSRASGLNAAPDGAVYFLDSYGHVIRRIGADGIITTIAGTGISGSAGDGGPAIAAQLSSPHTLARGRDGSLYVGERCRLRRITPDGTINTIAGTGTCPGWNDGSGRDGVSATKTNLAIDLVAVGPDSTVYFVDFRGVRRIDAAGTLRTIVPKGTYWDYGYGSPASQGEIVPITSLAVGPDGSLYIGGNWTIRKVTPDGILRRHAGCREGNSYDRGCTYAPDGTNALSGDPGSSLRRLAVGEDGTVYVGNRYEIRAITPDGLINTVAGGGDFSKYYNDNDVPRAGVLDDVDALAIPPDGGLLFSEDSVVRKISALRPSIASNEVVVPSEDGAEVYVFTPEGQHLRTVNAVTGAPVFTFGYDGQGQLLSVTDGNGQVTRIQRDASGAPLAIEAAGGQRTSLILSREGYVAEATSAAGMRRYTYTGDGLLTNYVDPRGQLHSYGYDHLGRLIRDIDPAGGAQTLERVQSGEYVSATIRSAEGRASAFTMSTMPDRSLFRTSRTASGLTTTVSRTLTGQTVTTLANGMKLTEQESSDPRFGGTLPFMSKMTLRMPSGRTTTVSQTRSVELRDAFSIGSGTWRTTSNGRTAETRYDGATRTFTVLSAAGRSSLLRLDALGRIVDQTLPNVASTSYQYDGQGRVSSARFGTRENTFTYDARGNLTAVRDPLGRTFQAEYDAADRLTRQILPDGRFIGFTWDADGNLLSIQPPGRGAHAFTHTPVGLAETYTPPAAATLAGSLQFAYDRDGLLTRVARADGQALQMTYDGDGRIATLGQPGGTLSFAYLPGGQLGTISGNPATLSYSYDGSLLTGTSWSGDISGSIRWDYDNNFWLKEETIGAERVAFSYDNDGLLTSAGALAIRRDGTNGLVTGTTLSGIVDQYTYNQFGEVAGYSVSYNGAPLLSFNYTRGNAGRIAAIGSQGFEYDLAGRLVRVTNAGTPVAEYAYDTNSNRTSHNFLGGSNTATYDEQDRVLKYGDTTYEYTANGELKSKTLAGATTTFDYDAPGNLRSVVLPGGTRIEYVIDGQNRRVGKKVNGTLIQGWLYADQLRIVAELGGTNTVVSRFVYGTRSNVPDYMIKGGVTYRILSDHLGSPRLVVNVADGTIAQSRTYDEFGRVLSDTNPGLIPFGFAGGLYDTDTGLVRFGQRDYSAAEGRWTAKDPILFYGGDTNLYGYVFNDPVNSIDQTGEAAGNPALSPEGIEAATALGLMWDNYQKMRRANFKGADRYYHCMAQCEASSMGPVGWATAQGVGLGRELIDFWANIYNPWKQLSPGESYADCKADMAANAQGRSSPRKPAKTTCAQRCKSLIPRGFTP